MRFPGPPSRFTCSNCHSGTAMQIRGTVAGIYGIRRLQVKRCGRLDQGPSSHLTVAVSQGPEAVSCQKCTQRGAFQWSCARKGWFSGTRVRFSMGSCPKGVVFRHGTDSILHCRPQVSSQKKDTCRGVERFSSILPHLNSNWSYMAKIN